ncbi:hypothetical protein Glove_357g66 [Diversispora epigaea]|uniref:Uncharacterized protein n=1 Tax=Diversispora epigaea TaxID=1348612 RepID=A0A397HF26_9GLOM|nr:hypothetical protein Glove_357g66 [Diversispora epigaea]
MKHDLKRKLHVTNIIITDYSPCPRAKEFNESQILKRYLRRDFSKQLQIDDLGNAIHNSYISHCLRYAFGDCDQSHSEISNRKTYLNAQLNLKLLQLNLDGALLIVDYKIKILPKTSSLHSVIEILEKKPRWITIISDNGSHYHNTELMIILLYWKEWYNINIKNWIFLEAGETKTIIDSHHAITG